MRNLTIKQRLKALKRRYSKVSPKKFFYNEKRELKRSYSRIHTWFLIQDQERGYSIFPFDVQRKTAFTVAEWTKLFKHPYGGYESIYSVFTQAVLPAINNRSGASWRFIALIGWAGKHDLPKTKDTAGNRRGNKTAAKGNANARNSNRRRHGNKTR